MDKRQVIFYTGKLPSQTSSGTEMRVFTNTRAYLDLGFDVQIVYLVPNPEGVSRGPILGLESARIDVVRINDSLPSLLQRLACRFGYPFTLWVKVLFPDVQAIQTEVTLRHRRDPSAIHHFEYLQTAISSVGLNEINAVWSCHDLQSSRFVAIRKDRSANGRPWNAVEVSRKQRLLRIAEERTAAACRLILMIADHEQRDFHEDRGYKHAILLPMSIPDERPVDRQRNWAESGKLRLLHLGSIGGFIGFNSLKFILQHVLPLLPSDALERMELIVAGRDSASDRSREIHALAERYRQVKFAGFVDDLRNLYATCDLQLVGSTVASGLRTRIIESFAWGIPVLSTSIGAEGIVGLRPGHNILLADEPADFAAKLVECLNRPSTLDAIATAGRVHYLTHYSRQVAAATLERALSSLS